MWLSARKVGIFWIIYADEKLFGFCLFLGDWQRICLIFFLFNWKISEIIPEIESL